MSNKEEQQYLDLLKELIESGEEKEDRTGVGTLSKFGHMMRFDLSDGTLPLLTTKKVFFRGVVEELLFFIRGDRDTKKLEEKGVNIWKGNTSKEFLQKRGLKYEEGDMGPMYGVQLRDFGGDTVRSHYEKMNDFRQSIKQGYGSIPPSSRKGADQLRYVYETIKKDPTSRRILMTTLNPMEVNQGVLWPCHGIAVQFNVRGDNLDCLWYQRSWDLFLGASFNIASYALLTHMMAKATGLKAGHLIAQSGDTHLYKNHIEQAKEQITRSPYPFPKLKINIDIDSLSDMERVKYEHLEVVDYQHHPAIKAPMAV